MNSRIVWPRRSWLRQVAQFAHRLRRDDSGLALIEFAFSLPIFTGLGMYGIEMSNLAMINMEMSQAALNLADNASRLGQTGSSATSVSIQESDVNTTFAGLALQTNRAALLTKGRVILSSLERNSSGGQWIHWQRCIGTYNASSRYGTEDTGKTGTTFPGMGPAGKELQAPANAAVMFVELTYNYKGLFGNMFTENKQLYHRAAHLIRDDRVLNGGLVNDVSSTNQKLCSKFTSS